MVGVMELQRRRATAIKDLRALLDAAGNEDRALTDAEVIKHDELLRSQDDLGKRIEREKQTGELEEGLRAVEPRRGAEQPQKPEGETTGFRGLGEMLQAVASVREGRRDPRLYEFRDAASGMSEFVPSDGGFLVQKDMAQELIKKTYDVAVVAPRCRRITVSGNGLKLKGIDETSRANGSRWGGVLAYWQAEADTATATKPKFREIDLDLKKLLAFCYATDELLADATALESVITQAFAEEMAFKLDDAIINGDGVGKPLGVLAAPCLVSVTGETGQTSTTIVAENVIKMRSRLWARSRGGAVWLINQDCEPQLMTMGVAVGTGGIPVWLPANGLTTIPYDRLFGAPVIPIEQCATMGTVGDIIYGDFGEYLLIEKGGLQAASSIHVRFLYDENCFRFVLRTDGEPSWNSALTPFKGSNTISPFVAVATR